VKKRARVIAGSDNVMGLELNNAGFFTVEADLVTALVELPSRPTIAYGGRTPVVKLVLRREIARSAIESNPRERTAHAGKAVRAGDFLVAGGAGRRISVGRHCGLPARSGPFERSLRAARPHVSENRHRGGQQQHEEARFGRSQLVFRMRRIFPHLRKISTPAQRNGFGRGVLSEDVAAAAAERRLLAGQGLEERDDIRVLAVGVSLPQLNAPHHFDRLGQRVRGAVGKYGYVSSTSRSGNFEAEPIRVAPVTATRPSAGLSVRCGSTRPILRNDVPPAAGPL
jgi:hypothetical protein